MRRLALLCTAFGVVMLSGCGKPDTRALQLLACQQVANSIDVQSVSQLDLLRKALGLAPGVDPIGTCRKLGVPMGGGGHGSSAPPSCTQADADNETDSQ